MYMARPHSSLIWYLTWCWSQIQISSGVGPKSGEMYPCHIPEQHKEDIKHCSFCKTDKTNRQMFIWLWMCSGDIRLWTQLTIVASVFFSHSLQYTMLSPLYDFVSKVLSKPLSCKNKTVVCPFSFILSQAVVLLVVMCTSALQISYKLLAHLLDSDKNMCTS